MRMESGLGGPPLTVVVLIGLHLDVVKNILLFILSRKWVSQLLTTMLHPPSIPPSLHPPVPLSFSLPQGIFVDDHL